MKTMHNIPATLKRGISGSRLVIASVLCFFAQLSMATPPPANDMQAAIQWQQVKSKLFDEVKVNEKKTLGTTKIYLGKAEVSYDKRWMRDFKRRVTSRYLEQTKEELQQRLHDQLVKHFEKSKRFTIVETAQDGAITVKPMISNVRINAPETIAITEFYYHYAGGAKIDFEVTSGSGQPVLQISDYRETQYRDPVRKGSRVFVMQDFKFLFSDWADDLVATLKSHS